VVAWWILGLISFLHRLELLEEEVKVVSLVCVLELVLVTTVLITNSTGGDSV
jgi:hypothetical protein